MLSLGWRWDEYFLILFQEILIHENYWSSILTTSVYSLTHPMTSILRTTVSWSWSPALPFRQGWHPQTFPHEVWHVYFTLGLLNHFCDLCGLFDLQTWATSDPVLVLFFSELRLSPHSAMPLSMGWGGLETNGLVLSSSHPSFLFVFF